MTDNKNNNNGTDQTAGTPRGGAGGPEDSDVRDLGKKGPRPPRSPRSVREPAGAKPKKLKKPKKPTVPEKQEAPATAEAAGGEQKMEEPPVEKEKKVRQKKEKKPRQKKGKKPKEKKEKKPLFGKKRKKAEEEEAIAAAVAAEEQKPGEKKKKKKKEKKPLFGGRKKKEAAAAGAAAAAAKSTKKGKGKRGGGLGGTKVSPVGLDIGRTSITAARLRYRTGGSEILQAALDVLPEGLISEGEVKDVEALGFALKDFWKKHKIKGRKVSLGLANQKVVVRSLEFPMLDEKELQSAIEFQAQDYIPIPVEEAVFAHHIMGTVTSEDGTEMQKVLIVAAQKDMVMDFVNAVKKAKLTVDGIDLQAFAMMRSMTPSSFLDEERSREAVAIANIASDITNIVVDLGGEPQFTRIISFGGDNFTKAVQEHQGLPFNEAELLKIKAGLPEPGTGEPREESAAGGPPGGPAPPAADMGGIEPEDIPFRPGGPGSPEEGTPQFPGEELGGMPPGGTEPPEQPGGQVFGPPPGQSPAEGAADEAALSEEERILQVQRILEVTAEALADELRRSFDYYMSQESAVPISMLLLSGGGALLPNIEKYLSHNFPFEVKMGDPSARVVDNKTDLTDEELQALAPRLAIAVGLALEDEES